MKIARIVAATALGISCLVVGAADRKVDLSKLPPPSERKDLSYARDIRPILEKSCVKCHGPEKQKGKLRLDSLQALRKGSEDGKVVEPGKSDRSVLLRKVGRIMADDEDWMPPKNQGEALTKEEVSLLRAWIDQGVK